MKELKDYIFESTINYKNIIDAYKHVFKDSLYPKCSRKSLLGDTKKHPNELIRAYFGDEHDEIKNNIFKLFNEYCGFTSADITLGEITTDKMLSGEYDSIIVTYNNPDKISKKIPVNKNGVYKHVIILTGNTKINKKQLTPDNLGLAVENNLYTNYQEIRNKLSENKNVTIDALVNLIDNIVNSPSGKVYDSFDELIDKDMFRDISFIYDTELKLTSQDINKIIVDFGEVLGPCLIFSKLKPNSIQISYPTESNAKLYDYKIIDSNNTYNISAKGNNGSSTSLIDLSKNIITTYNPDKSDIIGKFIKEVFTILSDNKRPYVLKQSINLFNLIYDNRNTVIDNDIDIKNIYNIKKLLFDNDIFVDENNIWELNTVNIQKLYDDNKLKDILKKLYTYTNYKPSNKYSIDSILTQWHSNYKLLTGCIIYPIRQYIIDILNQEKYNEYISKLISNALNGYVMNIVKSDNNLKFTIHKQNLDEYKLEPSGAVTDVTNKAISFKVK